MATPTKTSLENISSRCLHFFAVIPIPSSCTMCSNYPLTERVVTALKLTERMKNLLSCAHVIHNTLNMVILRCCLVEYGEEMNQNLKDAQGLCFFSLNPIVLRRSSCRLRSSFLNSLIYLYHSAAMLSLRRIKTLGFARQASH